MLFYQKLLVFLLRIALGWIFFYAGISKIMTANWSAVGFLKGAKLFQGMYFYFADPSIVSYVSMINKWALLLLGISLILGIFIRFSAPLGAVLLVLYYLPRGLPHPDPTSYIVDSHWIYAIALLLLAAFHAGRYWGVAGWYSKTLYFKKHPKLRGLLD